LLIAQTKVINETFLKLLAVKAQPYFKKTLSCAIVSGTVILPPLVFPVAALLRHIYLWCFPIAAVKTFYGTVPPFSSFWTKNRSRRGVHYPVKPIFSPLKKSLKQKGRRNNQHNDTLLNDS
jgi:hypothetical protein